MEIKKEDTTTEFHAVEFMRQVRNELTEKYFQDKGKYLDYLKTSMEEFKALQAKASSPKSVLQ